ncbi:MAG: DUF3179 domain-containing protein [Acidobacteria bacterium]|nr:DUF3179 domain-containing protein [Acidobacteriota bacterium]
MVYTRTVGGKELTFASHGSLYKDALVLFDHQTKSLWTQVDGTALHGPMAGRRLRALPSMQTTWGVWKRLHPDTLVLKKCRTLKNTSYRTYQANPEQLGITGTRNPDPRLPEKSWWWACARGRRRWPFPPAP